MDIFKFVGKLLPRIERSEIAEDLRTTSKEVTNVAVPSWASAADHFKISKPISEEVKDLQLLFNRSFNFRRASKNINFITDISVRLKNLESNVLHIQSILDDVLEKDIITAGLTVRSAFVIRSAGNMSMVSRYLLSLLNYIYTMETMARNEEVLDALSISKDEIKYVERNFDTFVKMFGEYTQLPEEFKQAIVNIPEAYVNKATQAALANMVAATTLDPFQTSGVAGLIGNPIYSVRMVIANWQNERYLSAQSKKNQLENRLAYLEMQAHGKKDPILEKEIMQLQDRIEQLDYKLRETDKELGI